MRIAAGFARLAEVTPAMFEDVSDEELAKYDKFFVEMSEIGQRQGAIIAEIQVRPIFILTLTDVSDVLASCFFLAVMTGFGMGLQRLNELFLRSRRDDPAVKDREHALQNLDLAYHKYKEIMGNLDEGIKVR